MNEWAKTLVTSSVIATVIGGGVSLLVSWYKIEQELHSRQIEAGYEDLVRANTLSWQSTLLAEEAEREKNKALEAEAKKLKRESEALITVARQKIAAFGDEHVVKAMSNYYSKHGKAAVSCDNKDKFRSDTQIYKAIRNTLGVGGSVSDEHLANLIFNCSLK
ncbi:MAG TPA: hypothetical protein VN494_00015 [Patescibacteria group bacterium]|nr:hypothetical protein [Patescibacteria group bacterium]